MRARSLRMSVSRKLCAADPLVVTEPDVLAGLERGVAEVGFEVPQMVVSIDDRKVFIHGPEASRDGPGASIRGRRSTRQ